MAIFFSLLSGLLLIFSFPVSSSGFSFWPCAWVGFVPLFFALQNKTKLKAFWLAYLTGVIFWAGTIYWLVHVTLAGTIVLVLYLALYFGIFGFVFSFTYLLPTTYYLLVIPSIWVILEYTRSHLLTGFPWALLGYSQSQNLPIIQIADIAGAWGVSWLVMMGNLVAYSWFVVRGSWFVRLKKNTVFLLVIAIVLIHGFYKLYERRTTNDERRVKVSVVQGNIPQELKWAAGSEGYIIEKYLEITRQAAVDKPDLIIWPEASLPVVLEEEPLFFEKVKALAKEINSPLLLGAVTQREDLYYNSALLVSRAGEAVICYDKLHLVPFGEYIPLKKIFPFLETIAPIGDIERGKEHVVFGLPSPQVPKSPVTFSVLICFEDLFPELSREFVRKGADFLVNITNDAWYKKTSAPYQHLQASVFRAVENRVFLARSANTGVSGFITPAGRVISLVKNKDGGKIFIDGYAAEEITIPKKSLSFYSRYGDIFIVVCFLFVIISASLIFKK